MKKRNLLNVAYAAVFSLGLMAGTAQASDMSIIYADDDLAIVNVGTQFDGEPSGTIEQLSNYIDDDASIAQVGNEREHVAHNDELDADIYADDDLDIVRIGGVRAHCKV